MRILLATLALGFLALVADHLHATPNQLGENTGSPTDRRPNIIVVFIDDMGYSDFSCFGGTVKTQHVDRLAAEGIRFTNFYVNSPICSPSRPG